jgi:cytochrome c-type biogenesis protein CcmH
MTKLGIVAALLVLGAVGCTKKDEESGKPAGLPPLSAGPPPPSPPAPPQAPAVPPPGATTAPAPQAAPPSPGASITGEITLASSLRAKVTPSDTVFLVARRISDNPSARGSLVAVKKLSAASFPIPFSLSAEDMPFQNGAFAGELTLAVRVDKDGNPMTRTKGDVFGTLPKVQVGAHHVKLVLDQLQKEDESLAQPGGPPMGGPARLPGLPPGHP